MLWVALAVVGAALVAAGCLPLMLWWALREAGEDAPPVRRPMLISPPVWRAFLSWRHDRPLRLAHRERG